MAVPKKMFRTHPALGFFQSTLVTTEDAAEQLAADGWDDNEPAGFKEGSVPGDDAALATEGVIDAVVSPDVLV